MKRCPLCGQEFEEETSCPNCGVLLIDMESNQAVEVENPKRIRQREKEMKKQEKRQQRQQKTDTASQRPSRAGRQFSINPKVVMIGGGVVVLLIICMILIHVVRHSNDGKTATDTEYQSEDFAKGMTEESEDEVTEKDEKITLNEADFEQNEAVSFQTDDFEFKLPAYWKNLSRVQNGNGMITFYQKKSEADGMNGYLFEVAQITKENLKEYDSYDILQEEGNSVYAIIYSDEKTYDSTDAYAALEYKRLMEDVNDVISSFKVTKKSNGDYVIADSNSRYLTREDLTSLSREELLYARNEIYARHGRKFQDAGIQAYFNSKSWYKGTVNPEDFTDAMLNEYEKKNATFILSYEKEKGYM